ncbi:hypothetical protein OG874_33445 [Nocardia sp. NBC_00565]|uniref:hypothetical protein n=1 Tax=Nocardia sp. NBC_00565 TaxID=2975993 RepID=UPI002E8222A4|nr:hypothetical protein [Nocardia sp. NBC_00565]WUC01652.1 hypothetical protein OG874_33445 [Nocardia sp. NBC_00565]
MIESALGALRGSSSRDLDRDCDVYARGYIRERIEPQFVVGSADFDTDPYLICADRYWNLRFREQPTLHTAAECAAWLGVHVAAGFQAAVREKWALGYGFITRDSVESAGEIADTTADVIAGHDSDCSRAFFATLYHSGKLRANLCFDELHQFLESSPLALAAGSHRDAPLFTALRAFAAFGSRQVTERYARTLFDQAWQAPGRTRATVDVVLNGLAVSVPFEEQGELLRTTAAEALTAYPGDFMFYYRLATGQFLCGDHDGALESIDQALDRLPAVGWRGSHELLLEQFTNQRLVILNGRTIARHAAAQQDRIDRHEQALAGVLGSVRRSMIQAVELVTLFAAIIAFAVGSLNITLNGNLGVGDRVQILLVFGGALMLFALLVVGGVWLIARRLSGPDLEP